MSDKNCKLLLSMGFKREDAVDALRASDNSIERAIEMLTTSNDNDEGAADDDDDLHDHNQGQQDADPQLHQQDDSSTPHELVRLCEMLETHLNQVRSIAVRLSQDDDNFKKALMEVATKITAQVKEEGGEPSNDIDAKDEIIIQRLVNLGFDRRSVVEAFLQAEKDEHGALTFLLEKAAS